MTEVTTIWHGTTAERIDLSTAIAHNCVCDAESGFVCQPHVACRDDQRWFDNLVFARRIAAKLLSSEFSP